MISEKTKGILEIAAAVAITIIVILAAPYFESFRQLEYVGVFLISVLSSATVLIPAPGWAFVIAMGRTLNPIWVGVFAGMGSAIGELTGYLLGYGGESIIDSNRIKEFREQKQWIRRSEIFAIFVLAALPNPLFDIAGIAAGALRIPWWRFLLVCAAGKIVKFVVLAYLGLGSNLFF